MLPRYTFMKGDPCPHGSYDCLCDVQLDGRGETPVLTDCHHMFHKAALDELGDDMVSSRNIVEFFSIVLGQHMLYEEMLDSMPEEYDQNEQVWEPSLRTAELRSDKWDLVDPTIAAAFHAHWKVGTPWSIARHELPLDTPQETVDVLCKVYRNNRNKEAHNRRRLGSTRPRKMLEQPGVCVVCGNDFVSRRVSTGAPWSISCSAKCKAIRDRTLKTERQRNARKAARVSA